MKQKEKEWFDILHNSQLEDLKVFMKPKYFNVFNGVIDKYSDSAHFIFELLQNADDAGATEVEMELQHDKFIFSHNGRVRFTVSDPEKEVEDREKGRLGHINSICSIGFSSKNYESEIKEIKIGKFGVGFKAVFQYTSTPEIYDNPFCFRIDNYIVPTAIEPGVFQKAGRTVFVLPFNHECISSKKSFEEISQKLLSLEYPQLFLHNIRTITWRTPSSSDKIEKALEIEGEECDASYALYNLKKGSKEKQRVLLISRTIEINGHGKHNITIGYYIDHGRINTKTTRNLYCFFPTNENIGTCYVIHAPFALVDNRQQIKRNNDINRELFKAVAKLAADSLLILRDWEGQDKVKLLNDNILQLIKYDTGSYDGDDYWHSYNRISTFFEQSYERIFEEESLFLSRNGEYLHKSHSWWALDDIQRLFTDTQIDELTLFNNKGSDDEEEDEYDYDEDDEDDFSDEPYGFILCSATQREVEDCKINIDKLDGECLAKIISSDFMKRQSLEWLNRFYDYVLRRRLVEDYEINKGNRSNAPMRYAQIVKNLNGEFVSAYDNSDKLKVFFFEEGVTTPDESINTQLYDESVKFQEVIKKLEIKIPSYLDSIRIQINRQEEKLSNKETLLISDINEIFTKAINFYNGCSLDERKELIRLMKESTIFLCDHNDDEDGVWVTNIKDLYSDNPHLREYFSVVKDNKTRNFFNSESYISCIEIVGKEAFDTFINEFNLNTKPSIINQTMGLTPEERALRGSTHIYNKEFPSFDCLLQVLDSLESGNGSRNLSIYVWELLVKAYKSDVSFFKNNVSHYSYYGIKTQQWNYNSLIRELQSRRWIYIGDELKCIKEDAYKEDILEEGYIFNPDFFAKLEISSTPNVQEAAVISEMSETTREAFALGKELKSLGFNSVDEIKKMKARLDLLEKKEEAQAIAQQERQSRAERRKQEEEAFQEMPIRKMSSGVQEKDFDAPDNERARSKKKDQQKNDKNIDEILAGFAEKAKVEREEFEKVANLRDRIYQSDKYSYEWLTSLMELEVKSQGGERAAGKTSLHISFGKPETNPKNDRMLILTDPSRVIPLSLEEMDALPVTFVFKDGTEETFKFESVSVKDDYLILINTTAIIKAIKDRLGSISYSYLEVNQPIELLSEWQSRINGLGLNPKDSLKNSLRDDIEFIFGPPGTGKTTTLAKRINEIVSGIEKEMKILVLAPTNKACDVLTRKMLEVCEGDDSWIWRFEKTDDPYLEEQEVIYNRSCRVSDQRKVCVISTIARYAFDGFDDGLIREIDWDYVFIDEASMIPLYQILPCLYNRQASQIIVSGDPFQIEPIVNIDLWKGENIYTMINLHDFVTPSTEPVQYKVTPLMTQYRSIPTIGELFSNYLYGGKLVHSRKDEEHRILKMGLKESPLNLISFPVGKESIFDLKRLSGSNIQVYSVIFTVEFLKYISWNLNENHKEDDNPVKIGVISPYSAEIKAIQKIYTQSCPIFDNIDVVFGSAHGFQGDQCDIIIAVMNPPASGLKRAADMTFVNNKNILNVAISRASDYLFMLIPERDYENFNSLYEIKKIGKKMISLGSNNYTNDLIENAMYGHSMHIEQITYVTSHKMTNVFTNPFSKYEVRIDESAIDVQINDL